MPTCITSTIDPKDIPIMVSVRMHNPSSWDTAQLSPSALESLKAELGEHFDRLTTGLCKIEVVEGQAEPIVWKADPRAFSFSPDEPEEEVKARLELHCKDWAREAQ